MTARFSTLTSIHMNKTHPLRLMTQNVTYRDIQHGNRIDKVDILKIYSKNGRCHLVITKAREMDNT